MRKVLQAGTLTVTGGTILVVDPCLAKAWRDQKLGPKMKAHVKAGQHVLDFPGFRAVAVQGVLDGVYPVDVQYGRNGIGKVTVNFGGTGWKSKFLGETTTDSAAFMIIDTKLLTHWKHGEAGDPNNHYHEVTHAILPADYGQGLKGQVFAFFAEGIPAIEGLYDEDRLAQLVIRFDGDEEEVM